MSGKPTVLCLVGPTACHKSEISLRLAKQLNGELVSADSVAVYRGLDIGSAKPTKEEREQIPHHLIDIVDICDRDFSVAVFRNKAIEAIDQILSSNKLPIVVGGSGLYSDSIFSAMQFSAPSQPEVRSLIEKEYLSDPHAVYDRLKSCDPVSANKLHINDAKRIIRALEVYCISGKPFSEWNTEFQKVQESNEHYRVIRIGFDMDRDLLYKRIELRVDRMFELGLVDEAFSIFDKGYTPEEYPALQSIGYAQLYQAYVGECSIEDAKSQIKLDTRHFAKRQLTWFRRNKNTQWYRIDTYPSIESFYSELEGDIINLL